MIKFFKYFSFLFIISAVLFGQLGKKNIQESIEQRAKDYENIAKSIWGWAELGYQEEKSSALLKKTLSNEGFSIKSGVA
ncbi:MAG TPA: amidohydrolase, partial [Candidatus Marinimicrobia bacterium]|nr:amidohydrolase [Candidatus Neomarinimicrobiota bacterium]